MPVGQSPQSPPAFVNEIQQSHFLMENGLIKAETLPRTSFRYGSSDVLTLVSDTLYLDALYVADAFWCEGLCIEITTSNSYTASNENRLGLYRINGANMELVAQSENLGDLFTAATQAKIFVPFDGATPHKYLQKGAYFTGILHSKSAGTAPIIRATGVELILNAACAKASLPTDVAMCYTLASQTSMPSSVALSGLTTSLAPRWAGLF